MTANEDIQTGMAIMTCDSDGELYPLTSILSSAQAKASIPSTFAAISSNLWHDRLGHPGVSILNSLRRNNFIQCNKISSPLLCQACVLGKHVKLPFPVSTTSTHLPFDIIHSDIWTSPIPVSAVSKLSASIAR